MKRRRTILAGALALAMAVALPGIGRANDKDKDKDKDKDGNKASAPTTLVNFGAHLPQTPDPAPVGAAVTHFLDPEEVTIPKGASVTFLVNGGGHGIAIHPVSKTTTRADIAEDLCDGNAHETGAGKEVADRRARAAVCNNVATVANSTANPLPPGFLPPTQVMIGNVAVLVYGTSNLNYTITDGKDDDDKDKDGKDHVIIETGFNLTALNSVSVPQTIITNASVDDPNHTVRHFSTSGRGVAGESAATSPNPAFLTAGDRLEVRFEKPGRYLVICMQRTHSLNDHMFGFVNVTGDDDDK